jgi:hypothetical protein
MLTRRFASVTCDLWQQHPHTLLAHRPCPPVTHSIRFVALSNSTWTSDGSGSSGRSVAGFLEFNEKREAVTLADGEPRNLSEVLG